MPNAHDISAPAAAPLLTVERAGLAAFLLPVLRPGDAGSAVLNPGDVTLTYTFKYPLMIPFGGVEAFEITKGLFGRSVRLRLNNGDKIISGLSQAQAETLTAGLESALADWWRTYLEDHRDIFESALNRAGQFADLQQYMRHSAFHDLKDDAAPVVRKLPKKAPEQLPETDEIRRVKAVLSFLQDPHGFRTRVNEGFVSLELERSKVFFDSVESKPLTDEQRRAVVVDEDHNLVVAAAGSGKTSVIAAKTAWLIKKGYCSPSKILLLTFAKDAQNEMEQRIHAGLDHAAASQVTVRTFHSLGLSIIGEAEGKKPSLAKEADDVFALSELLKDIVVSLLKDKAFSNVMHTWFQSHFPFQSRSEFSTWDKYQVSSDARNVPCRAIKSKAMRNVISPIFFSSTASLMNTRVNTNTTKARPNTGSISPTSIFWAQKFILNISVSTLTARRLRVLTVISTT
ncbi:MAG: UvrD-helicase domain-containing protein [Rhodospirillales bacterium]